MRTPRWLLTVVGAAAGLIGIGLVAVALVVLVGQLTQRDAAGYYSSAPYELAGTGRAVVLNDVDLDLGAAWPWIEVPGGQLASVRVTVDPLTGRDVFIGIAPQADVAAYLTGVAHEQLVDVREGRLDLRSVTGDALPADAGRQGFWVASTAGVGRQELSWPIRNGRWAVVVMNVDSSAPVGGLVSVGAQVAYVTPIALGLLALGALVLLGAGVMIAGGIAPGTHPVGTEPTHRRYPLSIEAHRTEVPGRWLWTVKWLLVVPHVARAHRLVVGVRRATVVAGLSILVTGRYPRGLFEFNIGVLRWTWRVGHYSYLALGTDRYPPFTLRATDHPATLEIAYPERLSRPLVLVKWLLAVPHLLIVGILVGRIGLDSDPSGAADGRRRTARRPRARRPASTSP